MDNETGQSDFFIRLPLLEGVRIIREVKSAFALYFWYIARTTVEFQFRRVRIGGVLGLSPHTDQCIADDLQRYGTFCSADQIRKWRRKLIRCGLIVCKRTPVGSRTMVIDSAKFPHRAASALPSWAEKCLAVCWAQRRTLSAKNAGSVADVRVPANCLPPCDNSKMLQDMELS